MAGHLLGVLESSVVLQINRDAGCPPGVTSDGGEKARRFGPLPNCSPGVVAIQSTSRYLCSNRINALEQGLPALKACDQNVFVQYSLKPDTEFLGIESSSVLASSRLQTGVLPFLTTYFGPRTECAGFDRVICRTTRKSYNIRTAASFSLMVGLDPGKSSIQAATWNGRTVVSSRP